MDPARVSIMHCLIVSLTLAAAGLWQSDARADWIGSYLYVASDPTDEEKPAVAYDSLQDRYLIVWSDAGDIFGRFVSGDGGTMSSVLTISAAGPAEGYPAVAFKAGTGDFLVVWHTGAAGFYDVWMALVDPAGGVGVPAPVAVTPGVNEWFPDVAANPSAVPGGTEDVFLVVYKDSSYGVRGKWVDPGGVVCPGPALAGFNISTNGWTHPIDCPAVAYGEGSTADFFAVTVRSEVDPYPLQRYLVTTDALPGCIAPYATVTAPVAVVSSLPKLYRHNDARPDLAYGPVSQTWLVAWAQEVGTDVLIAAKRFVAGFGGGLATVSEVLPAAHPIDHVYGLSVAAASTSCANFVVAFDGRTGVDGEPDLYARSVYADGSVGTLDTHPTTGFPERFPAITYGPGTFLTSWERECCVPWSWNIRANRYESTPCAESPRGDSNCDGDVNFADINAFVLALSDPKLYRQQYPKCDLLYSDINGDGMVNFKDIRPFVELLGQ